MLSGSGILRQENKSLSLIFWVKSNFIFFVLVIVNIWIPAQSNLQEDIPLCDSSKSIFMVASVVLLPFQLLRLQGYFAQCFEICSVGDIEL